MSREQPPDAIVSKRRKILIVTDAWKPQINGVVRTYEQLAAALEKKGHDVRVIGPSSFPRKLPLPGYREIELAVLPRRRLRALIEDYAPTSLHIATEGPLGWAARHYCLDKEIPFTTAYHTQFPAYVGRRVGRFLPFLEQPAQNLTDALVRRFHAPAAGMITTTPTLEQELRTRGYSVPFYRMVRGVCARSFSPGKETLFSHLTGPVALYVGRVAIEKNLEDFLRMDWPGSKVVVGDGPSLNALKAKYPDVLFTGKKTGADLVSHYRSSDVFVFPSRTDTFGIVLAEALACGLPVAAYNVMGPRDIITEPFLGHLHEHDLAAAARGALALTGDSQKRHDHAREHLSWDTAAAQFLEILEETKS